MPSLYIFQADKGPFTYYVIKKSAISNPSPPSVIIRNHGRNPPSNCTILRNHGLILALTRALFFTRARLVVSLPEKGFLNDYFLHSYIECGILAYDYGAARAVHVYNSYCWNRASLSFVVHCSLQSSLNIVAYWSQFCPFIECVFYLRRYFWYGRLLIQDSELLAWSW